MMTSFADFTATKKAAFEQKVLGNPWLQGTLIAGAFIALIGAAWAALWLKRKVLGK
jgi:hypothetical protein